VVVLHQVEVEVVVEAAVEEVASLSTSQLYTD
jgi:hypothetical protein